MVEWRSSSTHSWWACLSSFIPGHSKEESLITTEDETSHVAHIIVTILTSIVALTNSMLGIKCLMCHVHAIETLPPKKCIQSVCLYLELFYTVYEIKCNHRFKCCFNTVFIQYVAVVGSIHVGGLDVSVNFSALIILPIARCLPIWGFVPPVLTQSLWFRNPGYRFPAVWKKGKEESSEETNLYGAVSFNVLCHRLCYTVVWRDRFLKNIDWISWKQVMC
jgi:hypothetical protein